MTRGAAGPKAGAEAVADPRRWWALVVLGASLLALTVQDTIVTVALPTLARELSASASQLQWIVEAYILALAGLVIPFGVLSDRYGRRLSFVAGLAVFGAASLAGAIAPSAGWLIASRVAMGVGAALVMPSTLSIIRAIFPAEERKTAIAVWGGIAALGVVVGPLAGGWLLENFSWGSVFLVNVPITVAAVLGAIFLVPESRHPSSVPLDLAGAGLAIAAMCAVTFGITEAPSLGWSDPLTLGPLAVGALLIGAFVLRERRTPHPMIDLRLFANRRFSAAILSVALAYSALFGIFFIVAQYLQFVLGYGPLTAGLGLAPLVVTIVPASFLGARLASRLGDRATISGGLLIAAAGLAVLSFATPSTGYALLAAAFVVIGLGIGAVGTAATDSVMDSAPEEKAGGAAAINEMAMQLGGALGIAALGSALSVGYARAFGGANRAAAESIGAAALLNVHPNTVRNRVRAGMYDAEKVSTEHGFTWMIDHASLVNNPLPKASQASPSQTVNLEGAQPLEVVQELLRPFVEDLGRVREEPPTAASFHSRHPKPLGRLPALDTSLYRGHGGIFGALRPGKYRRRIPTRPQTSRSITTPP